MQELNLSPRKNPRHMHRLLSLTLSALLLTAGCSSNSKQDHSGVIIDRRGVNMAQYEIDLKDCEQYASEVRVAEKTGTGAAGGAVVGGAIGAIIDRNRSLERGAGIGAVSGGAQGYALAKREQDRVVKNCLRGRGYRVLN